MTNFERKTDGVFRYQADDPVLSDDTPFEGLVFSIDGQNIHTEEELFEKLGDALRFPPSFGKNWNAVYDYLTDLSWLPFSGRLLLVFRHADVMRSATPEAFQLLLGVFRDAATFWLAR